jgi:hypothetical protein
VPLEKVGMPELTGRPWVPSGSEELVQRIAAQTASSGMEAVDRRIHALIGDNQRIHERQSVNLNPAANAMNPRAEDALSARLGSRPSLGYRGQTVNVSFTVSAFTNRIAGSNNSIRHHDRVDSAHPQVVT